MKILAIDTTAVAASAAIVENGHILAEFFTNVGLQHSRTLMPMVESILSCTALTMQDIDLLAVAKGPGSFTGVRIGVAAVKGLALPEDKPCIGVSTLDELACNASHLEGILCPVMDARCKQFYNALFSASCGCTERLCDDRAISAEELKTELKNYKKTVFLIGDGAQLCYNELKDLENISLVPENIRFQRASGVAFAAERAVGDGLAATGASELLPSYLRPPQAVRNLKAKQ